MDNHWDGADLGHSAKVMPTLSLKLATGRFRVLFANLHLVSHGVDIERWDFSQGGRKPSFKRRLPSGPCCSRSHKC